MFRDTLFENWEDELSELSNSFPKRMIYKREVILLKMNTSEKASKYHSRKNSYVDIIVSEKWKEIQYMEYLFYERMIHEKNWAVG